MSIPDPDYRRKVRQRWENAVRKHLEDAESFEAQEARLTRKDGSACDVVVHYASLGKRAVVALSDVSYNFV